MKVKIRTFESFKNDPLAIIKNDYIDYKGAKNILVDSMFQYLGESVQIELVGKLWQTKDENNWIIEPWMIEEKYREAMNVK